MSRISSWFQEYTRHFNEEMKKSDNLPKGFVKGKIIKTQVADGYAYYEITKVSKNTVYLKWRKDLSCDGYKDYILGDGIKIDKDRIEGLVYFADVNAGFRKERIKK